MDTMITMVRSSFFQEEDEQILNVVSCDAERETNEYVARLHLLTRKFPPTSPALNHADSLENRYRGCWLNMLCFISCNEGGPATTT